MSLSELVLLRSEVSYATLITGFTLEIRSDLPGAPEKCRLCLVAPGYGITIAAHTSKQSHTWIIGIITTLEKNEYQVMYTVQWNPSNLDTIGTE